MQTIESVDRMTRASGPTTRILVADEYRVFAPGLARLLGDACEIVTTSRGAASLRDDVRRERPAIVIVGLSVDPTGGLDVLDGLRRCAPETRLVVLTQWADGGLAAEAFRRGASAYVLQSSDAAELLDAISAALAGQSYISAHVTGDAIHSLLTGPRGAGGERLTAAQRDVVRQFAEGKSMKETAAALNIAPRTVAFHKYRVMQKFRIKSSAELVRFAIKQGLIHAMVSFSVSWISA